MPLISTCICEKCNNTYHVSELELSIVPGMRLNSDDGRPPKAVKRPLTTWADWIDHIVNNCPKCRFVRPPKACLDDLTSIKQSRWQKRDE